MYLLIIQSGLGSTNMYPFKICVGQKQLTLWYSVFISSVEPANLAQHMALSRSPSGTRPRRSTARYHLPSRSHRRDNSSRATPTRGSRSPSTVPMATASSNSLPCRSLHRAPWREQQNAVYTYYGNWCKGKWWQVRWDCSKLHSPLFKNIEAWALSGMCYIYQFWSTI